ncbi:hypothetical protein [Sphaerisporangium sp. NPDC051011]|uniref:ATP-binding protein n=1 Tax=Sphaerisporangium sp. NPDC051011 TaxID=3155792 RepID=UPI0033C53154
MAEALACPAVRLFADRAEAVSPGFEVDAGNVDAVARVCAALDGLPLAIELAAARLRTLPVREIAARLGAAAGQDGGDVPHDRFRLLSRGDRTAAPRHQTLRAVVEWSWDLLEREEQVLARRLTVFRGGVAPAAASEVCGLPRDHCDELLAGLVDKSFVEVSAGRYRLLETIREFCAERLAEAGERESLRAAHAAYFQELARTAEPHLRRHEQLAWLARLDAEHGNLHAALGWAVHAAPDVALRLMADLSFYWWLRGLGSESAPPAMELLRVVGVDPPEDLEDEYIACVFMAGWEGFHGAELRAHRARVDAVIASGEWLPRQAFTMVLWGVAIGPGDVEHIEWEPDPLAEPWLWALRRLGMGYIELFAARPREAARLFTVSLQGYRAVGDRWGALQAIDALADAAERLGEHARALALVDEALELAHRLQGAEETADLLCRRAGILAFLGRRDEARATYERVAGIAAGTGARPTRASAHLGLGELARLEGDLAAARRFGELALTECTSEWVSAEGTRVRVLICLGRVAEAEGDATEAEARYARALAAARGLGDQASVALAVAALAGVLETDLTPPRTTETP